MYVTRPLSLYNNNPNASSAPPPEGPGSGMLVMWDETSEAEAMSCWGLCKDTRLHKLPFPQNRKTVIRYTTGSGEHQSTTYDEVYFIPVIGQPLSSNLYYAIKADGRKAATCSREEDMGTCLCCNFVNDIKPVAFDPTNIYQQVEIIPRGHGGFTAKAVASDGFPPNFLRRKGWRAYTSVPKSFVFEGEANGIDMPLRSRMPGLDSPPVVVGKWYSPFIFIKEGDHRSKDQMKKSMYYEITLQQFWEEIYACGKSSTTLSSNGENKVKLSASVRRQMALLNGNESVEDEVMVVDEFMWFKAVKTIIENGFGLSMVVWERMRWEENRFGWLNGMEKVVRVERVEEYEGDGWKRFSCFVLVERFVFKRMDGSLAFTYDFKHVDKIRAKWE